MSSPAGNSRIKPFSPPLSPQRGSCPRQIHDQDSDRPSDYVPLALATTLLLALLGALSSECCLSQPDVGVEVGICDSLRTVAEDHRRGSEEMGQLVAAARQRLAEKTREFDEKVVELQGLKRWLDESCTDDFTDLCEEFREHAQSLTAEVYDGLSLAMVEDQEAIDFYKKAAAEDQAILAAREFEYSTQCEQ